MLPGLLEGECLTNANGIQRDTKHSNPIRPGRNLPAPSCCGLRLPERHFNLEAVGHREGGNYAVPGDAITRHLVCSVLPLSKASRVDKSGIMTVDAEWEQVSPIPRDWCRQVGETG